MGTSPLQKRYNNFLGYRQEFFQRYLKKILNAFHLNLQMVLVRNSAEIILEIPLRIFPRIPTKIFFFYFFAKFFLHNFPFDYFLSIKLSFDRTGIPYNKGQWCVERPASRYLKALNKGNLLALLGIRQDMSARITSEIGSAVFVQEFIQK